MHKVKLQLLGNARGIGLIRLKISFLLHKETLEKGTHVFIVIQCKFCFCIVLL